ncbi:hypothetical protein M9H77_34925 [Catharanthus roseus]|uniref:Uncharacterized protein n=1 Tax=Catharanthus roseus TaxID=4058 RepID=A0ACB9ZMT6_CATRO|nr:hypothetical protein M9H77_34925 [Catharanthus roseus]
MRETEEKMEVESSNSAQALDLNCIRRFSILCFSSFLENFHSRIQELKDIRSNFEEVPQLNSSEVDELVKTCAQQLESKVDQIFSDTSDILSLSLNDLDDFLDQEELSSVEEENKKVEEECEELSRRYVEGWETKI